MVVQNKNRQIDKEVTLTQSQQNGEFINVHRAVISSPGLHRVSSIRTLKELQFLLLHRAKAKEGSFWPDYWECPGGKAEGPDEPVCQTLAREVLQETGLHVRPHFTEFLGKYHGLSSEDIGLANNVSYLATFHLVITEPGEVILSEEHDASVWVSLPELVEGFKEKVRPCSLHALREAHIFHIPELWRKKQLPIFVPGP